MNVPLEERLEKLKKLHYKLKNYTDFNAHTFRVSPEIVIFQNFEIGETYSTYLTILNLREVSSPLKIVRNPSQYFEVTHSTETVCTKIAPGMSYQLKITFSPEELKDYVYSIGLRTETEKFHVRILGMLF